MSHNPPVRPPLPKRPLKWKGGGPSLASTGRGHIQAVKDEPEDRDQNEVGRRSHHVPTVAAARPLINRPGLTGGRHVGAPPRGGFPAPGRTRAPQAPRPATKGSNAIPLPPRTPGQPYKGSSSAELQERYVVEGSSKDLPSVDDQPMQKRRRLSPSVHSQPSLPVLDNTSVRIKKEPDNEVSPPTPSFSRSTSTPTTEEVTVKVERDAQTIPECGEVKKEDEPVLLFDHPRSTSSTSLSSSGTFFVPMVVGCERGQPNSVEARKRWKAKEVASLVEGGKRVTRVLIRQDGMAIDWVIGPRVARSLPSNQPTARPRQSPSLGTYIARPAQIPNSQDLEVEPEPRLTAAPPYTHEVLPYDPEALRHTVATNGLASSLGLARVILPGGALRPSRRPVSRQPQADQPLGSSEQALPQRLTPTTEVLASLGTQDQGNGTDPPGRQLSVARQLELELGLKRKEDDQRDEAQVIEQLAHSTEEEDPPIVLAGPIPPRWALLSKMSVGITAGDIPPPHVISLPSPPAIGPHQPPGNDSQANPEKDGDAPRQPALSPVTIWPVYAINLDAEAYLFWMQYCRIFDGNRLALVPAYCQEATFSYRICGTLSSEAIFKDSSSSLGSSCTTIRVGPRAIADQLSLMATSVHSSPGLSDEGSPGHTAPSERQTLTGERFPWIVMPLSNQLFASSQWQGQGTGVDPPQSATQAIQNMLMTCHGDMVMPTATEPGCAVSFHRSFVVRRNIRGDATYDYWPWKILCDQLTIRPWTKESPWSENDTW